MKGNAKQKVDLWLVATPIGNLEDLSPRAVQILSSVDFIAAEDTRNSGRLLQHFGIKKPMISYFEHNIVSRGEEILHRIGQGQTCALVSDAGMPAVSDPGEMIVRQCMEAGYKVSAVPGPCAFVCAVAMSGLSTKRFTFEGFLSTAKNSRREHLQSLATDTHTLIFYEAPHKLRGTLEDMLKYLGDRRISLVREISKIYEEVLTGTISEAIEYYRTSDPIGEFVLVIEGTTDKAEETPDDDRLEGEFRSLVSSGMSGTQAAKTLAARYGLSKRDIYGKFAVNKDKSGK